MSLFTCISCHIGFKDPEMQRQHYKTDWHIYNLKRKVANLPPVTAEGFQERIIAYNNKNDQSIKKFNDKKGGKKKGKGKNQHENHLLLENHNVVVSTETSDNPKKVEQCASMVDQNPNKLNVKTNNKSGIEVTYSNELEKLQKKVVARRSKYNELKEINNINPNEFKEQADTESDVETVDSDEWIDDCNNPIETNDCLFCDHHSRSLMRNLNHMKMVHSFFIPNSEYCIDIKGLLLYLGEKIFAGYMCIWCNYSGREFQSEEAARAHMIDKGHCKMLYEGNTLSEYEDFYNYTSSYPDGETNNIDEEVKISTLDDSGYQLVLPSGKVIGHRSLMRYYKQSLNPNKLVVVSKNQKLNKIWSPYKTLGWIGTQKEIAQKARDIKYMQRKQARYSTQLQFKANKLQRCSKLRINV